MHGTTRLNLSMPYNPSFPEKYLKALSGFVAAEEFFLHYKNRSFAHIFGRDSSALICSTKSIRYCPACLSNCFHSPFFQFATLKECPHHHMPLVMGCSKCGMPLGTPNFHPINFSSPMCCPHCKQPFARKRFSIKLLTGRTEGTHAFERLEGEMAGLKHFHFKEEPSMLGEPWTPKDYEKICQAIAGVAINQSFFTSSGLCKSSRWHQCKSLGTREYIAESEGRPLLQEIEPLVSIAKSINRLLKKHVLKICGHKHPSRLGWKSENLPFSCPEGLISAELHNCPCCALLTQWRAYSGKIIALRNIMRKKDDVYDIYGSFRHQYSLTPNVFAEALISSFAWFVHAFCSHIKNLTGKNSPNWFHGDQENIASRVPFNRVYFSTYRFYLQMFGYIIQKDDGEEFFITISFRSALEELKIYYEEIFSKKYKTNVPVYSKNSDEWYICLSEHFAWLDSKKWSIISVKDLLRKH